MALSGSIVQNVGSHWRVVLEWTATQSVTNNQSYVNAKMYWESFNSYGQVNSTATKEVGIQYNDGAWDRKTAAGLAGLSANQKKLIHSKSFTINHNSDGTSVFSLDGYFDVNVTLSGVYYGRVNLAQVNFTLNTIPRSSTPTLNDYHVYYGDSFIIYTNRASSSFTHRLRYNFSGNTGTIATGVGTSYTWTLPTSFMNYIPNATIDNGTIYCDTYDSGGSLIGTKTVTMKGYVPSSVIPTISGVNAAEYFQTLIDFMASTTGPYVQGKSKLKMTVSTPVGTYSSTIESFIYTVDGKTYTTGSSGYKLSDFLYGTGTLTLTGKVKDSRGMESTARSITISVLPYQAPKVTGFTLERADSDGTLNDLGEYAKVTRAGTWSDLGLRNNLDITLRSKPRGTTTWTTKNTLAAGTSGSHGDVITVGTYAVISSFDFRLDFVDAFNTTLSLTVLSTGLVTMSWGKNGVGVGKVHQQGALDVGGDIYSTGDMVTANHKSYRALDTSGIDYRIGAISDTDEVWIGDADLPMQIYGSPVTIDGFKAPMVRTGYVSITPTADSPTSVAISYGKTFSTSPRTVVTANTSVPGSVFIEASTTSHTTTGCEIVIYRTSSTTTGINWVTALAE